MTIEAIFDDVSHVYNELAEMGVLTSILLPISPRELSS